MPILSLCDSDAVYSDWVDEWVMEPEKKRGGVFVMCLGQTQPQSLSSLFL